MSKHFSNPEVFDPDRFSAERREDKNLMAYQPFGGGKHKCSGNAFAMFQIKAIFAVLLRRYEFALVDAPETYKDNYKEMIVQPVSPCRVRYTRRDPASFSSSLGKSADETGNSCPMHAAQTADVPKVKLKKVIVDTGLCQGHGVCVAEAAQYFKLDDTGQLQIIKSVISDVELENVQQAVRYCPNQALKIIEEEV
jgi:sterol 14-demethylase